MVVCIVSALVVYDYLAHFILFFLGKDGRSSKVQVTAPLVCC